MLNTAQEYIHKQINEYEADHIFSVKTNNLI